MNIFDLIARERESMESRIFVDNKHNKRLLDFDSLPERYRLKSVILAQIVRVNFVGNKNFI